MRNTRVRDGMNFVQCFVGVCCAGVSHYAVVVFSGRGPMFYINMGDEDRETIDGDVCFGRVEEGREVLDEIAGNKGLFSMVGIQSVEAINETM